MKLEFVKQGNDFELPRKILTVGDEIEILDYLDREAKEKTENVRTYMEFVETVYRVLLKIDAGMTREMIRENLDVGDLAMLYTLFRSKGQARYCCPHCEKEFAYVDLVKKERDMGGDKNFRKQEKDIIKTKKTISKT